MSRPPTVASLTSRIDALEAGHRVGPLSKLELAELDQLERDYAAMFPRPLASMLAAELDDLLEHHRSPAAARYAELRARIPSTPEEIAKSQQLLAQLDAMTAEETGAFLAAMAKLPSWRIGR